jgi:hypothetical protein
VEEIKSPPFGKEIYTLYENLRLWRSQKRNITILLRKVKITNRRIKFPFPLRGINSLREGKPYKFKGKFGWIFDPIQNFLALGPLHLKFDFRKLGLASSNFF